MSAKPAEERSTALDRIQQMKLGNGPPGAVGFLAVTRNHQRWPAVAFDDAGCGDANHSAMPAVAIDHHAVRIAQGSFVAEALLDRIQHPALLLLAFAVQLVEPYGDLTRLGGIFRAEKIDHIARNIHPPGCVDSGSDAEGDFS